MKKVLFTAIAVMISLMAGAQQLKVQKGMGLPVAKTAASIEGASVWGYYMGNGSDLGGVGTQSTGTFGVAIKVPGNGVLAGSKIQGINLPVMTSKMTNVKVFGGTQLGSDDLFSKDVTVSSTGYQSITLDDEVSIPMSGMYVGYTFGIPSASTNAEKYPMGVAEGEAAGSLYLSLDGRTYQDYSKNGFGMSALQIFVSNVVMPTNGASVGGVMSDAAAMGKEGNLTVTISSNGENGVSNFGYTLNINGVETTGTVTMSPKIAGGLNQTGVTNIKFVAPNSVGSFPASLAITTVNGEPNELSTEPVPFTINTVSRIAPRMTVIEEFTGTKCGYCPRGWVGMEAVKTMRSDKALVIALHDYYPYDVMHGASYASLDFDGAPQCTVDRKTYPDPYYGEVEEGIIETVNKYNASVATVDVVDLTARFTNDTNKQVEVTANTEFLTDTEGYTIAFALTADQVEGTTSSWKQSNYYYQYTAQSAGILPSMPDLAKFCKNGEYGKSSILIPFDDVLIGSSYNTSGKTLVPAFTNGTAGSIETSEYTLSMPTSTTLVNALKYDKIYVTALIIDEYGQIANARRVRVLGAGETPEGPDGPDQPGVVGGFAVSPISAESQLMGETMSPNAKFVAGTNFITYAPALWNVATGAITNYEVNEEGAFHGVNNSGLAVGDDGQYALAIKEDGTEIELFFNEGEIKHNDEYDFDYSTGDAGSAAWAVSEDGKVIAGCYYDTNYKTTPCIWNENGERTDLPLPTEAEVGAGIDGAQVRWMTPDASTLLGFVHDDFSTWPACIWTKNDKGGYDVNAICKDFWEPSFQMGKPYMVFHPCGISENGEWLSLSVQAEYNDWDFSVPAPLEQAARLNIKSGKLEVLGDEGETYHAGGIANDGTMVMYVGEDMIGRSGYVWSEGKTITALDDMLAGALAKATASADAGLLTNTPCTITADGKNIQGFAMDDTEEANIFSYVMTIDLGTDAVENISIMPVAKNSDSVYNIAGQKLNNISKRGLYIINGKKVMK